MPRRRWRTTWFELTAIVLGFLASTVAADPGHVPIYSPQRTFKPSDVHARLSSPSPFENPMESLVKHVAQNPEQLKTLLSAAGRAQQLLGKDQKLPLKPEMLNHQLADLAKKLGNDPALREQIMKDPEFQKLAEDLRDKLPDGFLDSMRERFGKQFMPDNASAAPSSGGERLPPPSVIKPQTVTARADNGNPAAPPLSPAREDLGRSSSTPPPSRPEPARQPSPTGRPAAPPSLSPPSPLPPADGAPSASPIETSLAESLQPGARPAAAGKEGANVAKFKPSSGRGDDLADRMLRTADELRRRGGPLGESESLRETIEQLRTGRYTAQGEGTARLIDRVTKHADLLRDSLSQLPEKTRETRRWGESLASSTHEWLPSPPKLPSLPRLSLPKVSLPKIPATSMPTLPNLSLSGSAPAGWKMVLGVTLVVGILFLMSYLLIFGPRLHGARRGVWKGKLEAATIHDASTLQKAFENLALHLLGGHARSQHHRSIAAQLAASDPELKNAALDLSSMYERARYTPPPQQLTEQELLQANELYTHLAKKRPI